VSDGEPTTRAIVVKTAFPVLSSVAVPSEVLPLKKLTLPVGVPDPVAAVTVAVSVTGWPVTAAVGAATNTVFDAWRTFAVTACEVLVRKFVSPEYLAVIELAPSGSVVVGSEATPELSVTGEPMSVVPFKNWTVPVGVPAPGLTAETVALSVTVPPRPDGLGVTVTSEVVLAWATTTVVAVDVLGA
jgi:hypothetical protein